MTFLWISSADEESLAKVAIEGTFCISESNRNETAVNLDPRIFESGKTETQPEHARTCESLTAS